MMIKKNTLIYTTLTLLSWYVPIVESKGEQQQTQGIIKEAEFVIKKERPHQLPEASRLIKKAPLPLPSSSTGIKLNYQLQDMPLTWQILDHKIKILKAKPDLPTSLYGNCIKLGHGNYYMPYLMACLNSTKNKYYGYGLHVSHISEGRTKYAQAYHQEIMLHGTKVTQAWELSGSLHYLGDKYPLRESISNPHHRYYDLNAYKKYHQLQLGIQAHNHTKVPFQYRTNLQVGHLRNTTAYESQGKYNLQATYFLNPIFQLQTEIDACFSQYQYKSNTLHQQVVNFKPALAITYNAFLLQLGTTVAYQNDTRQLATSLHAYPDLKLSYEFSKSHRPYIGLRGQMDINTWQGMVEKNPWLTPQTEIKPTEQAYIFYTGLQSNFPNQFTCHTGLSVSKQRNWPCFINNPIDPRHFDITYDPAATITHIFAEITKPSFEETLVTRLKASFFKYSLSHLKTPWHQPTYAIELLNNYNFYEKIRFKANLHCLGGIQAFDPISNATQPLSTTIDIDLGIDYLWNQRISLFLDCQNLLAKANNRYLYSPEGGFHFLIGVSYIW